MAELTPVTAREADQNLSRLLDRIEAYGEGFLITKRGCPVARPLPVEEGQSGLTPEQRVVLEELLGEKMQLDGEWRFNRDELHER
jgi:antitoxin (DNA-binding transcriptional repressor) of toxin-antitoxin stability system